MPQYEFISETGEKIVVFQGMNDPHVYEGAGGPWRRLYSVPQTNLKTDPFNERHFMEKTQNGGTFGELMDLSAEMSAARSAKRDGVDPLRVKKIANSRRARGGKPTNADIKDAQNKEITI